MTHQAQIPAQHLERAQIDALISAAGIAGARTILDAFWSSTQDLLTDIHEKSDDQDYAGAAAAAHAIKGSAANVGAVELAAIANELETFLSAGDTPSARETFERLSSSIAEARAQFEEHLNRAA